MLTKETALELSFFKTSPYEEAIEAIPKRVKGTCNWFLDHDTFTAWKESDKNALLWLTADPGCGKTVISKALVQEKLANTGNATICYYFFKDNEDQNSATTALCALLHQLFCTRKELMKHAISIREQHGEMLKSQAEALWQLFIAAATDPSTGDVICILDALDECRYSDQARLIERLVAFYDRREVQTKAGSKLKFLVTSRPCRDIEKQFHDLTERVPIVRLAGEEESAKISAEIEIVIIDEVRRLPLESSLKSALYKRLLENTHRNYLWLHLTIDQIKNWDYMTQRQLLKEISKLPETVEQAYEKLLNNFSKKGHAREILQIIVAAQRPLMLKELKIILAILLSAQTPLSYKNLYIGDDESMRNYIRQCCGLFVSIVDSRVYLIHQTAKEFLLAEKGCEPQRKGWKHSIGVQKSHYKLAHICITYLSFSEFHDGKLFDEFQSRLSETEKHLPQSQHARGLLDNRLQGEHLELLNYAVVYWPEHMRESSELALKFFNSPSLFFDEDPRLWENWWSIYIKIRGVKWLPRDDLPFLHVACFFGITSWVRQIQSRNLMSRVIHRFRISKDKHGVSLLLLAAVGGHEYVVQMLLDKGADGNARVGGQLDYLSARLKSGLGGEEEVQLLFGSALAAASYGGHEKVVQLLLNRGADVNEQLGGEFGSALAVASRGGHEKVVQLLLGKGADVNAQPHSWYGYGYVNTLAATVGGGCKQVVQLLLDKSADINALATAFRGGYEQVVQQQLDKGADVNAQPHGVYKYGYVNALAAASRGGHEQVVQLLLDKGANINAKLGGECGSALAAASSRGHEQVVKLLLDRGADVNAKLGGLRYGSALAAASGKGHEQVVQLLLDRGADVNAKLGDMYGSAFAAASVRGHEQVVQLLLARGAKPVY